MLHALQSGELHPTAMLFLHGAGLNARQWNAQLAALGGAFHCIAPDLPEHGDSAAYGPLTLSGAAQQVLTLLGALAPGKPVHLVGHSFGATLGLYLLGQAPQRFSSALLTGGAAELSPLLARLSNWSAGLSALVPPGALLTWSFRALGLPEAQRPVFERDMRRASRPDFLRRLTHEMQGLRLPRAACAPVLALVGEHETRPARQAARTIAAQLPRAQAWEVPGARHVWNLETPELFSSVVRHWTGHISVGPPLRPLS